MRIYLIKKKNNAKQTCPGKKNKGFNLQTWSKQRKETAKRIFPSEGLWWCQSWLIATIMAHTLIMHECRPNIINSWNCEGRDQEINKCVKPVLHLHLEDASLPSSYNAVKLYFVSKCVPWKLNPQPLGCEHNNAFPTELHTRNKPFNS